MELQDVLKTVRAYQKSGGKVEVAPNAKLDLDGWLFSLEEGFEIMVGQLVNEFGDLPMAYRKLNIKN